MTEPRAYEDNLVAFVDNTLPYASAPPSPAAAEPVPPRRGPQRGPHHDVPVSAVEIARAAARAKTVQE